MLNARLAAPIASNYPIKKYRRSDENSSGPLCHILLKFAAFLVGRFTARVGPRGQQDERVRSAFRKRFRDFTNSATPDAPRNMPA